MINISLTGKVIKVTCSEKVYQFTDQNGQIEINNIIAFFNETDSGLLKGEIEYILNENDKLENGLKLFINELFTKLQEEKAIFEEKLEIEEQSDVEHELISPV
jgi:hypothetical protein